MDDNKVVISIWEYSDLTRKAERINAVKRLIDQTGYVSVDDIKAILDIKEEVKVESDGKL